MEETGRENTEEAKNGGLEEGKEVEVEGERGWKAEDDTAARARRKYWG